MLIFLIKIVYIVKRIFVNLQASFAKSILFINRTDTNLMTVLKTNFVPIKIRFSKRFYSQDGEDVLLFSFYDQRHDYKGFYVDIGAYHPFKYSNTQFFYERSWRGINIDATPASMKSFKKYRKGDINIECAISDKNGEQVYYSFEEGALNTFNADLAEEMIEIGWKLKEKISIKTCLINDILEKNLPKNKKIDFINIDIEGLELKILNSFDFEKYAPDYFLIEELDCISSDFANGAKSDIYNLLKQKGYRAIAKTRRTVIYSKLFLE